MGKKIPCERWCQKSASALIYDCHCEKQGKWFVYKNFHPASVTTRWSGIEKKKKKRGHSGKFESEENAFFNVGNNLI